MGRRSVMTAALLAGVLVPGSLAAGCATAEASPAVRPVDIDLVSYGGADPPSGEYNDLAVRCIDDLRTGRDAECESRAEAASASSDSQVAALGRLFTTVSEVNQGETTLSPQQMQAVEEDLDRLPPAVRKPATELVYRAASIAFAANDDQSAADDAMRTAQEAAPDDRAEEIAAERCRAAPTAPSCPDGKPEQNPNQEAPNDKDARPDNPDDQSENEHGDKKGPYDGEKNDNDKGGGEQGGQQDAQPGNP